MFLAAFLRLFRLNSLPAGLAWDEASIAYNAYGIDTVHRDEWLRVMPFTFKAFGEYKGPVAIYADAITIALFGINPFAIRLPMALAGIIAVAGSYWLGLFLFRRKEYAFLLMGLMAVSPLSMHYSRIAFESTIAIACIVLGCVFFFYATKKSWLYFCSAFFFVIALYANHSTKIFLPVFLLVLVIQFRQQVFKQWKNILCAGAFAVLLLLPLARDLLHGEGNERFLMTSSIANQQTGKLKAWPEIFRIVSKNYFLHLDPHFLLFGKTYIYQNGNGVFGILSFVEFFFAIIGILAVLFKKEWRKKYAWIIFIVFLAIIPAAISQPVPHSNRVIHILPWIQFLAVCGYIFLGDHLKKNGKNNLRAVMLFAIMLELCWHVWVYSTIFGTVAAHDFQYGYQQAIAYAQTQENKVDTILFTAKYDQPYIYLLLYKRVNPIAYHNGALIQYRIQPLDWNNLWMRKRVLIVGTPQEIPFWAPHIVHEVLYPDGSVAFRVVEQ